MSEDRNQKANYEMTEASIKLAFANIALQEFKYEFATFVSHFNEATATSTNKDCSEYREIVEEVYFSVKIIVAKITELEPLLNFGGLGKILRQGQVLIAEIEKQEKEENN